VEHAQPGEPGSINHVGVEFASGEDVAAETERVAAQGVKVLVDDPHTCCFATQEKAWARDSDGVLWELYTVVSDTEHFGASPHGGTPVDVKLPPVTDDELAQAIADPNVVVIDAQGDGQFERAHIDGALNFALDDVLGQAKQAIEAKDQRVVVYCTDEACLGAEFVGTQLVEAGYSNVGRFPGGVDAWAQAGHRVVRGEAGA
jgi:rhodanese-related sulfurtransferase